MGPGTDLQAKLGRASQRTFLGHPIGLYVLFFTQMWERFSFFGMLALLILYLTKSLKLPQSEASNINKWYTSLIFFAALGGGYLADRFLGNKRSIILGIVLMGTGHFLMAVPSLTILFVALGCLIVGFGFLTPPLTSQVGLLYPPNDPRRDSAYTIFYMGINLGAAISPILCGWLRENTRGGFHSGFALPALGMVIALLTYLFGLRWVVEVDQKTAAPDVPAEKVEPKEVPAEETHVMAGRPPRPGPAEAGEPAAPQGPAVLSEEAVEKTPSALPLVNWLAPRFLTAVGAVLGVAAVAGLVDYFLPVVGIDLGLSKMIGITSLDTYLALAMAAACTLMFAWVAGSVRQGLRDRVLAIGLLFLFTVLYWGGGMQYSNAFNVWADQNTDRHLSSHAAPSIFPEATAADDAADEVEGATVWQRWINMFKLRSKPAEEEATSGDWWNPVPTEWFQSVNPVFILVLAPPFAMLWTWLGRRGLNPSIPTKMGLGLLLMTLAFAVMIGAARREAQSTSVPLKELPPPLTVNQQGQVCKADGDTPPVPYDAGRLFYDASSRSLRAVGVFPDLVRDEIAGDTAPEDFVKKLEELQKKTEEAAAGGTEGWSAQVQLERTPPGFNLRYAGYGKDPETTGDKQVSYDPATATLKATILLEDKEIKGLKVAAADQALRASLNALMQQADARRISPWWLVAFYLLATMGEMCLAPIGMSMVSQLAPARFSVMLMGLWLLVFAFGAYIAGEFGEKWGTWTPLHYFGVFTVILAVATVVLFLLVRKVAAMMHEPG
jgi:proton-dependent oligopeptide transporter, POT family